MEQPLHIAKRCDMLVGRAVAPNGTTAHVVDLKFFTADASNRAHEWPMLRLPPDLALELLRSLSQAFGSQPPSRSLN